MDARALAQRAGGQGRKTPLPAAKAEDSSSVSSDSEEDLDPCKVNRMATALIYQTLPNLLVNKGEYQKAEI